MTPAPCAPSTSARPSPSPAGWRGGATTAGSPSSTCATPAASSRWWSATPRSAHALRAEYCLKVTGEVSRTPRGQREPQPAHRRRSRSIAGDVEVLSASRAAAVPDRRRTSRWARRPGCSTATSTCAAAAPTPALRLRSKVNKAARDVLDEPRLRRGRDPDPDPLDARGRPRLPGAGPAAARQLVRPAAEPAAVQAAADGRRHGALLPDRALLPRRGLPRRPAAGVHPARHRDELRRAGRRHRAGRGDPGRALEAGRLRRADAAPADDVRRGDGAATAPTSPTCGWASSSSSAPTTSRTPRSGSSRRRTSAPS